tara:strand:+ start:467 stop:712 length:246 start_codon:yes stop_codon:yes gene_type:complete
MKNPKMPLTVKRWAEKNKDKVSDLFLEEDQAFDGGDWSIWCYLKTGWICADMECGTIHEPFACDFLDKAKSIMTQSEYDAK